MTTAVGEPPERGPDPDDPSRTATGTGEPRIPGGAARSRSGRPPTPLPFRRATDDWLEPHDGDDPANTADAGPGGHESPGGPQPAAEAAGAGATPERAAPRATGPGTPTPDWPPAATPEPQHWSGPETPNRSVPEHEERSVLDPQHWSGPETTNWLPPEHHDRPTPDPQNWARPETPTWSAPEHQDPYGPDPQRWSGPETPNSSAPEHEDRSVLDPQNRSGPGTPDWSAPEHHNWSAPATVNGPDTGEGAGSDTRTWSPPETSAPDGPRWPEWQPSPAAGDTRTWSPPETSEAPAPDTAVGPPAPAPEVPVRRAPAGRRQRREARAAEAAAAKAEAAQVAAAKAHLAGTPGPGTPSGEGRRPLPVLKIVAIGTSVALVGLTVGAVLVDTATGASRTPRRLVLAERDVGGLNEDELRHAVDQVASDLADRPVELRTSAGKVPVPSGSVGLTLDRPAAVAAARAVDRDVPLPLRPLQVLRSWFTDQEVPLRFTVDRARLAESATDAVRIAERPPTEPNVTLQGDSFAVVPGADGQRIDVDALAGRLTEAAATAPAGPWTVDVPVHTVPPRFSPQAAESLAKRANTVARSPLTVNAGGKRTTMPAPKVRSWLRAVPGEKGLELQADVEAVLRDVTAAVGTVGTPAQDITYKVSGDKVEMSGGKPGTKCCAPDTGTRVAEAMLAGKSTVNLDLVDVPAAHDKAWADKMGIVEKVGSFTTKHPAGQPRVTNIHLAADALRGAIIEPGGTLSLNKQLGQRTEAKGYVEDHVINDAVFATDVGGGISQLATTTFNAAFFAGLEFKSYMSHSIYIDRYPYGREATVSWPAPDLAIRNPSPFGVLVWTSYDDTSITVTLYSTKWAPGEQTNQTQEPAGPCTKVHTERTRTWVQGGRKEVDSVTALYQPEEGVSCPH
jgi:vancomycin resistance protein YoaR